MVRKSTCAAAALRSMFTYFFGLAGESKVKTYFLPVVLAKTLSCVRNSCSRAVKFCLSAAAGNSQSILKPSNKPGAVTPGAIFPLTNRLMHEEASAARPAAVAAAAANPVTSPACPPKEINTFKRDEAVSVAGSHQSFRKAEQYRACRSHE